MRGKIIVFEGLDYSFKQTNSIKLYNYIKDNITDKVVHLAFPNYDGACSKEIKYYLSGDIDYDAETIASYYFLNKKEMIEFCDIESKLNEGYYIIFDRYKLSNLAFQGTRAENMNIFIDKINNLYNKIPKEDFTIYMNMPVEISHELIKERDFKNGMSNDIHEENFNFKKKVENNYLYLLDKICSNKYAIINCIDNNNIKSEDIIFNNILNTLKDNNIL